MADEVLDNLWARRLVWSAAADKAGDRISAARTAALALGVAGAVLETAAATLLDGAPGLRTSAAGAGAVMLALATYFSTQLVNSDALKTWTTLRGVSEALRSEIFAFRARAGEYASPDRLEKLTERAGKILERAIEYERYTTGVMPGKSTLPPDLDEATYIEQRVKHQIEKFYRPRADLFATKLRRFRLATLLLGAASTALAALATLVSFEQTPGDGDLNIAAWVAVLTTLSGAFSAHVSASRHDFLVGNYTATASRLEALLNRWQARTVRDAAAWGTFVTAVEETMAAQNLTWVTKLASDSDNE